MHAINKREIVSYCLYSDRASSYTCKIDSNIFTTCIITVADYKNLAEQSLNTY